MSFQWPLMNGNFHRSDFMELYELLTGRDGTDISWKTDVRLTQGGQVRKFEEEFSKWQGCAYSVLVNSGSSANLLTMAALKEQLPKYWIAEAEQVKKEKVLVPCVTWSSDITSVLHTGFEPVFVDINRTTLGMDNLEAKNIIEKDDIAAVFVTHCMGYNAIVEQDFYKLFLNGCRPLLFEDCCESIGAKTKWAGRKHKVGVFGLASNFSFYYAHHMTTIEGGMVCTDNYNFAEMVRCLRGHGLLREMYSQNVLGHPPEVAFPDLEPQFIFLVEGFNCRSTEINATIGRSQLSRLDEGIEKRRENLKLFLALLDDSKYQTKFEVEGSSPYALTLVLENPDDDLAKRVSSLLRDNGIEFRRGIAGGGNQLRQPYLKSRYGTMYPKYPNAEHIHFYGYCIGNWPDLPKEEIQKLCKLLNDL